MVETAHTRGVMLMLLKMMTTFPINPAASCYTRDVTPTTAHFAQLQHGGLQRLLSDSRVKINTVVI